MNRAGGGRGEFHFLRTPPPLFGLTKMAQPLLSYLVQNLSCKTAAACCWLAHSTTARRGNNLTFPSLSLTLTYTHTHSHTHTQAHTHTHTHIHTLSLILSISFSWFETYLCKSAELCLKIFSKFCQASFRKQYERAGAVGQHNKLHSTEEVLPIAIVCHR